MAESPYGQVDGLCEFAEREFTTNILSHHVDDFFYSFIQGLNTRGDCVVSGKAAGSRRETADDFILLPRGFQDIVIMVDEQTFTVLLH